MTEQSKLPKSHLVRENYLALTEIPLELFNPYRLLIMQALIRHGNVEFRQLRHALPKMTDGNLASHLRALEKLQFIKTEKEILDKKVRTSYEVTSQGLDIFRQLEDAIKAFYDEGESCYG